MSQSPQPTRAGSNPGSGEVTPLFATPVLRFILPEAASVNAALRQTILAREQSHPSTQHSNQGGYQSTWDMEQWGGEALQRVLTHARNLADRLTCDRTGQPAKVAWKMNCWANINRSGHGNEAHAHAGSYWSGTYYVDDGGIGANPSLGGELEFQDPRGIGPAMYAPNLAFAVPGGLSVGASEVIPPVAGALVLFPAWLFHQVRPYTGNAQRISIAFNLSV
jgi:uncharacterized protein (TIGR02466 family)